MKFKRRFYTPGLISLIGIAIIHPFCFKKIISEKINIIQLYTPSENKSKDFFKHSMSKYYLEEYTNKKKRIKFILNENDEENFKKMSLIRTEALKLKYTQDTSSVVLLTLTDNTSYGDFIAVLDMCNYDHHKRFASWDDKFVIFGEWPPIKKETNVLYPDFGNDIFLIETPTQTKSLLNKFFDIIKRYYSWQGLILLSAWLLLIICFLYFKKNIFTPPPSSTP